MRKFLTGVMIVLGTLFAIATVLCLGTSGFNMGPKRSDRAKLDLSNICGGLELHRAKTRAYPQRLREMVDSGVLEKMPKDPWGNDYEYALGPNGPELWSYGSDGAPGGDGSAADIHEICSKP